MIRNLNDGVWAWGVGIPISLEECGEVALFI